MKRRWIGICLGDVAGVGPEVTLKTLAQLPVSDDGYLIFGDLGHLQRLNQRLQLGLDLRSFAGYSIQAGRFWVVNSLPQSLPETVPPGSALAARAAIAWLRDAADRCLRRELAAMVTAPLNKAAVIRSGLASFIGQTEFLSELAGTTSTAMMLLGSDDRGRWLRVALATTHVPLRQVSDHLQRAGLEQTIALAAQACQWLRLPRARVGVCGLNPHAGEEGHLGTEEIHLIAPAVQAMRQGGLDVVGPLAADTLFHQAWRGDFEAVVAMYHDQGLAPLKMIAFDTGVNWTLGLPFIRTSPDHGTAYDLAGQGVANPSSMKSAVELARFLAQPPGNP